MEDREFDTLTNPAFLVEVLSPSTERCDRGHKAIAYRMLPTLQALVLVSQEEARVEVQRRQPDGGVWSIADLAGLDASLELPELGIGIPLAEIYRRVLSA